MINIEILKDIEVDAEKNVCCFSGCAQRSKVLLKQRSRYSFYHAYQHEDKTYSLTINNDRRDLIHPDCLYNVPDKSFIFIEPHAKQIWTSDAKESWQDAFLRLLGYKITESKFHYVEYWKFNQGTIRTPDAYIVVTYPANTYIHKVPPCNMALRPAEDFPNLHFLLGVKY